MSSQNSGAVRNLRPYPKGASGNPGGRPKGFGRYIRTQTRGGRELVDLALAIARGTARQLVPDDSGQLHPVGPGPSIKEVLTALAWLADRGWGKATETVEYTSPGEKLSDEEILQRLRPLLQRLAEEKPQP